MNVNQTTGQEGDGMSLGTVRDLWLECHGMKLKKLEVVTNFFAPVRVRMTTIATQSKSVIRL